MKLGIIGNCQYSALIDPSGDVAWLCWPRFDSSFVFGNLLDDTKGGTFRISPAQPELGQQSYDVNTNVLRTRFHAPDGVFDVIDFAPRFPNHDRMFKPTALFRIIEPVEGQPMVKVACKPMTDYGAKPLLPVKGSNHLHFLGGEAPLRLTTDLSLTRILEERPFALTRRRYLALTWGRPLEAPLEATCEDFLKRTVAYWQRWVKHCHLPETHAREVIRSALALKLHQYEDTGAVIAAATTSIPEAPGSGRNWDYRYCWLRDSLFTVNALRQLSHFEELEGFVSFLGDVVRASPQHVQPVYAVSGAAELTETTLPHLAGYRGNGPVRVGNDAYRQQQHDAWGQMLMAISPMYTDVRFAGGHPQVDTALATLLLKGLERTLNAPDAGLWEFRGPPRIFAFTLLNHWAGARAAVSIAKAAGDRDLQEDAERLMKQATNSLMSHCWDPKAGLFVQAAGGSYLDASLLMLINLGFLPGHDARAKRLVDAIRHDLGTPRGFLKRYVNDDGLGETKNCFTICSFWLAEALARSGQFQEAEAVFANVVAHANSLGLFSEDVDPETGEQWGNFPQTYSHVGLINAAFALDAERYARSFAH